MKNFLNSVKIFKPRSNLFDLTHDVKLSGNMGNLIPICTIDCVPGDNFSIGCESLIRFAPMVAPIMHRVDVSMHYWFVPKRLVWPNWKNYITNTEVESAIPAAPFLTIDHDKYLALPLIDYMGLPDPGVGNSYNVNAIPFACYQMIWNEDYRDQNLIPDISEDIQLSDGDNNTGDGPLLELRKRAWEHDYFTSALPFAQKGDAVEIPISGVVELNNALSTGAQPKFVDASGNSPSNPVISDVFGGQPDIEITGAAVPHAYDPQGTLEVNNADTSINDLRRAVALQKFLEKLARGGSRLTEFIRTMFGVRSSDARLQRPEYITGLKTPVKIGEVLNTTGTDDAPQGQMAGHGAAITSGEYGNFFCEEHGYIIGVMSVMPKTAYQQGVPKHFLKINESYDHFLPDFANIGEQEIKNIEVYAPHATPNGTFGYIPRYGEYKFEQNRVAGDFRTTLDFWHLGRIFSTTPALNAAFIECDPSHRIFAVTDPDQHKLWCHVINKVYARRLMPKYGTPTF